MTGTAFTWLKFNPRKGKIYMAFRVLGISAMISEWVLTTVFVTLQMLKTSKRMDIAPYVLITIPVR